MNKITILLPVSIGDKLEFFKSAVESMLNQTYSDFTLLIQLDGAVKPEIEFYLKELSDSRIQVLRNEKNLGLPATLNRGIRELPADIYFRMDADDISFPERIEKTLAAFEQNPQVLLIGSECIEINSAGEQLFYKKMPKEDQLLEWAYTRNPFAHPSVAFKKEFIEQAGFYDEKLRKSQDYELWTRALVKDVKMLNLHQPLIYFRIADGFWKKRSSWNNVANEFKISYNLIREKKAYRHLPKLVAKLAIRLLSRMLPDVANKFIYMKLR